MRLTKYQIAKLTQISAPHLENDLSEEQLDDLCDYITDYVVSHEIRHDDVSDLGEALLDIHDDIIPDY
ncbi:MAG: hypothetical protein PHP39_00285 [Oscillospiraceae bacterium]|nr:hypothetical protein [Oscillospiraceae bacterium]